MEIIQMEQSKRGYYHSYMEHLPEIMQLTEEIESYLKRVHPEVTVYNPFKYGHQAYEELLKKYFLESWPSKVLIGLNPGVDGAVQSCIPFTDPFHGTKSLNIDICHYIQKQNNVDPSRYIGKAQEPSAKRMFEAIIDYLTVEEFFSNVLLLNAFPLGMSIPSTKPNKGGFYAKNLTPDHSYFKADVKNNLKKFSRKYLKLVLQQILQCDIIAMSSYARDMLKVLEKPHQYHLHPAPPALAGKMTSEQWKESFSKLFK